MSAQGEQLAGETAASVFARLNACGAGYAVLRNYEEFPRFGHDCDLVVATADLARWRETAVTCAAERGWAALTSCDHWAQSPVREQRIDILRFYSTEPPAYFQMDAFHSLPVLGMPLFDEETLLGSRVWDERGFYRIDERTENLYRLIQIASVIGKPGAAERIERYRSRAIEFWSRTQDFETFASSAGMSGLAAALELLRAGEPAAFKRRVDAEKRRWWLRKMGTHPLRGAGRGFERAIDLARLFRFRPCGFRLSVYAPDERPRALTQQALERLAGANLLIAFTTSADRRGQREAMERGGIAVDWTEAKEAALNADQCMDRDAFAERILTLLIERHPRLFDRRAKL